MEIASFIFGLLIFFQVKHFLADYPLQGKFMLKKFSPGWEFFIPLAAHAGVHALFTLALLLFIAPHLWYLALIDFVIHFVMDRVKAGPKYLGRFKALSGEEYMQTVRDERFARPPGPTPSWCDDMEEINKKRKHNVYFWWALGFDQMVHHVTHYYIIFALTMDKVLGC
ncbi:MAG: DUF3307 domain-containing protein [Promethearchaeota archaeon]|jgi:hypothetical protein